jgi:hypothetical protein
MAALMPRFKPSFSFISSPYKEKERYHPRDLLLHPNLRKKLFFESPKPIAKLTQRGWPGQPSQLVIVTFSQQLGSFPFELRVKIHT